MSGSKTGGLKAAETNKKQHGENFYSEIGKIGGAVKGVKKGFAANPDLAKSAGKLGGSKSVRVWTEEDKINHGIKIREARARRHEVR